MKLKLIKLLEYEISEYQLKENELNEIRKLNKFYFQNSNKNEGETGILNLVSKNRIKATQYVGVIQIKNKTIEVLPKIFSKKEKINEETIEEQSKIKKNLLFMLSYTNKLKLKETEISNLSKNSTLFESIIYLFAKNLIELLKKDLLRNYETREENTNFLKGKLLMAKHLKYNLFNKAKFYSQFDEFTEDNLLNQIFKATVNKLIKFTKNSKNFKLLSECDLILQDVLLKTISKNEINKIKFNRLNQQYEHIFNLAKLLLFGNSIELDSKNTKTYSLMFDMNKLFEEFIFVFIKKNCNENNYLIRSELPRKNLFEQTPQFQLKPDITFYDNENCKFIIDTKYKKINDIKSEKYGISTSDMYQMFTYSQMYNCENIILLYPEYNNKLNIETDCDFNFKNNKLTNFNIYPRTVNLHIDLIKNKQDLIDELNEILNINKNDKLNNE